MFDVLKYRSHVCPHQQRLCVVHCRLWDLHACARDVESRHLFFGRVVSARQRCVLGKHSLPRLRLGFHHRKHLWRRFPQQVDEHAVSRFQLEVAVKSNGHLAELTQAMASEYAFEALGYATNLSSSIDTFKTTQLHLISRRTASTSSTAKPGFR